MGRRASGTSNVGVTGAGEGGGEGGLRAGPPRMRPPGHQNFTGTGGKGGASHPQASAQARLCPPPVSPRPRAAGVMGLPLVGTGHRMCPQARSPLEGGVTLRVPSLCHGLSSW